MIFITGATGHIGNNLVRLLVAEGRPCKLLQRQSGPALADLGVEAIEGDIFDPDFLGCHVNPGDTLVHIAALIDLKNKYPELSDQVNNLGTRAIIDFCQARGVRLIHTSSVDCIDRSQNQPLVGEPDDIYPEHLKSNYAISKAKGTKYLLDKIRKEEMDAVILYPSAVIGPHDYKPSAAGMEIMKAMNKRLIFYIKGGYNFIDVGDCARAILACIDKSVRGQYILANHNATIKEFYREICVVANHKPVFLPVPGLLARAFVFLIPRFSKVMIDAILDNYRYDNSLMRRDLLEAPTPFPETVANTIAWFTDRHKDKT